MAKKRGNHEGTIVKRKDGRWMASITLGRDPATGKLKRAYFYGKTRQEAADQLATAMSDLSRGAFVAPHKITIGAWLDIWLKDYSKSKVRPLTFDSYDSLIRCHLAQALGHIPLKDLRPDQVQRFYNLKREAGLSAGTIGAIHTVLHAALRQAVRSQLVMRNVTEATTIPTRKPREIRPLSIEQVNHFLKAIKEDRWFCAIFLELGTGVRKSELLGLQWKNLDLDSGVLHIRQGLSRVKTHEPAGERKTKLVFQDPKTGHSRRTIPIPEDVCEELKRHRARQAEEKLLIGQAYKDHGLVFCQPDGQPIDPRTFNRVFNRLLRQAGLPHIRVHDGRHTFATLMLELGESPKTVQVMLGHSKITTTLDTYSHVSLELEKRAAAKLNAVLRG